MKGDVVVLPAERAFVLAGDLNAPRPKASKYSLMRLTKIAKVADGDDFFAVGARIALDPRRTPAGGSLSNQAIVSMSLIENLNSSRLNARS